MATRKAENNKRKERVPLTGGHARRLSLPPHMEADEAFHYRWFNDVQDRIVRALAAGYEFVDQKDMAGYHAGDDGLANEAGSVDSRVSKRLRGYTIYLMKIPMEFYLEDKAAIDSLADAIDDAIFEGGAGRVEKSYGLDVKYQNNRSR